MFNKFKNSINQNLNKFFIKENHEGKMVYELLHIYIQYLPLTDCSHFIENYYVSKM